MVLPTYASGFYFLQYSVFLETKNVDLTIGNHFHTNKDITVPSRQVSVTGYIKKNEI